MEFYPNGNFIYRYDLSRAGFWNGDFPSNILVGVQCAGVDERIDLSTLTNLTSLSFQRLMPGDSATNDWDGDGLTLADELFVYGTNPYETDTDLDGLSDSEEIEAGTDPVDAHSLNENLTDKMASILGDTDPYSIPEGSTNTVWEHAFYTGTTNGPFAYPQSTETKAVLTITISGSGSGELIIGSRVVPLLAPAQARARSSSNQTSLLVDLLKEVTHPIYLRGGEGLSLAFSSDDFAFGVLPTRHTSGHITFPNTTATTPCIHDFNARRTAVQLSVNPVSELLTCTWQGTEKVEVQNHPPRYAVITGKFSARETPPITYTLTHPNYLFGQTVYTQSVRFCPQPTEADDDAPWFDEGDGDSSTTSEEHPERWCCVWGLCDQWCSCGCDCVTSDNSDYSDSVDEICSVHNCAYTACASLHISDYTNAVQNLPPLEGVLYLRDPPRYETIYLETSSEHRNCCPCPDHWTNYVGVAYKSYRLRLLHPSGQDFDRSESSCTVQLAGIYPSESVGDATVAFSRNGEIYKTYSKTVLGVAITGGEDVNLKTMNTLNPRVGYVMNVCTNKHDATILELVTNVKLPGGYIHLELKDATAPFQIWYFDYNDARDYRPLLNTTDMQTKDLTMEKWKLLMRRGSDGESANLPIYITSSTTGSVSLVFRYWNVINGALVQDEVTQRITSTLPPLRLDITRDGSIDENDSAGWFDNRPFYYWVNEDTIKGDAIGLNSDTTPNVNDLVVNGAFDLVNFFPMALDLTTFKRAWGNRVTYKLNPRWTNGRTFNFCFANLPWDNVGSAQTTNVTTTAGESLSSASLIALPENGFELSTYFLNQFSENSGVLLCEAKSSYVSMRLDILYGDELLYSYVVPLTIMPVKSMYAWINSRYLSGESVNRPTYLRKIWDEKNTKSLIFLHGANVNEEQAEIWGDILFKRMWVSGVHADFYNVDWRSDIGSAANYHENASNAFAVASQLAPILSDIEGEKVIMAHSLGNMVVSSMIQDYGLEVSRYIMCNSAVPAEAYDESLAPTNVLVHSDWDEYPRKSFVNEWYKLFEDDESDDRQLLTWAGRFADVASVAVNFYSTGDHVLELAPQNNLWVTDGYENWDQMFERFSWHKQELWKGRKSTIAFLGTTDWSGWGIRENIVGVNTIQPTNAWLMSDAELKTNTVFHLQPSSMNTNAIPLLVRAAHLTQGIPSRTPASGAMAWGNDAMKKNMIDLQSVDEKTIGMARPNGWPVRPNGLFGNWGNRWLHSDIKDMAYFYVYRFFEKVKEKGGL